MKLRCLILDHDDTAVDSTREIHYPAHVEVMRRLRPGQSPISLEDWYLKNFDPGIMAYLQGELGMNAEELQTEFIIWRDFTSTRVPHFFPGFLEALREFRSRGGRIAVVSHSERNIIERDYRKRSGDLVPEIIFGWDHDEERRKPSPWPVERILSEFGLGPGEALIIDDLKPAVLMSQASGVAVAAAGWGHEIPLIRDFMRRNCVAFFSSVDEFRSFVLS
jgi:beta-phosphoglucomutase-like phosphatase (HAD superfamily)